MLDTIHARLGAEIRAIEAPAGVTANVECLVEDRNCPPGMR